MRVMRCVKTERRVDRRTSRTGANLNEISLTTANVNVSTFGKLFGMPVDGFVFPQPLTVAEFGKALAMADLQSFSHQI